jgi:predicted NAD/FAD-dependent oxidoreductase
MASSGAGKSVAVVGGGVAGSVCAVALRSAGLRVQLFDQGRHAIGGRAASRVVTSGSTCAGGQFEPPLVFDHGAQFFRAESPVLKRLLLSPLFEGLYAEWSGRFGLLGGYESAGLLPLDVIRTGAARVPARAMAGGGGDDAQQQAAMAAAAAAAGLAEIDFCGFIGGSGIDGGTSGGGGGGGGGGDGALYAGVAGGGGGLWQGLCERAGVTLRHGISVPPPRRTSQGRWALQTAAAGDQGDEGEEEEFDMLVLATHTPKMPTAVLSYLRYAHFVEEEMAPFRDALAELQTRLEGLAFQPVFSLMAAYDGVGGAGVPFDAAVPLGCERLRWIARDSSKPGRGR